MFKTSIQSTITALLLACGISTPIIAEEYNLTVDQVSVTITGKPTKALAVNGTIPGPLLRFQEGAEAVVHVTNNLDKNTSVHWHGLLLPGDMDGVPGFNGFKEIAPGETRTYRFPLRQSGTYWYHSHSGLQEQAGIYGPLIIEPEGTDPVQADHDYVVMLSDFTEENPESILRNLKVNPGHYNYSRRTIGDFFKDAKAHGLSNAIKDRNAWGKMRMDPTDLADVTGYTFLINGQTAEQNPNFAFQKGDKVRLRFINGSAMTYFDVRIPGLKMTVVEADGRDVQPVPVDEFRIAVAETYDVIVEPDADQAYTIFAESMDRSGFARATLSPAPRMSAALPGQRPRALLNMEDMGMSMDMGMDMSNDKTVTTGSMMQMEGDTHAMHHSTWLKRLMTWMLCPKRKCNRPAHMRWIMRRWIMRRWIMRRWIMRRWITALWITMPWIWIMVIRTCPVMQINRAAGVLGFQKRQKCLSYADLKSLVPNKDLRPPQREIIVNLTGNMERYIWTINDKKFADAKPVELRYGERVKMTFVNDTMMAHPMHLHGMFVELDNGQTTHKPEKHVVNVPPGKSYSVLITADEVGEWAFHCHLLYHMSSGMMRKVVVARMTAEADPQ